MKKIIFMGRSEAGKTTLTQAMRGEKIHYHKTQYMNHFDVIIDTPGEYAQTAWLARALALYTYEADIVGLLVAATEPYCLFPPCCTSTCNREVVGIVTMIRKQIPKGRQGGSPWPDAKRFFLWTPRPRKASPKSWNICGKRAM